MPHLVLISLILVFFKLGEMTDRFLTQYSLPGATAPGDIIIEGLFPIHEAVNDNTNRFSPPQRSNCTRFYTRGLSQALAMVHAVEMANKSPMLRKLDIALGYRIHDTCADVTTALRAVQYFTQMSSECVSTTNSSQSVQPTMAVIGTSSSEISIAIARELNLLLIPQISYASTAIILSDKIRFPAFMRTVPNDMYQTNAMVKLLKDKKWNWVGIITTDGDYGRSAMESFVAQATMEGICVAFKQILPDLLTDQKLNTSISQTVNTIINNPKVKVVVSFAKSAQMMSIFQGLRGEALHDMVWVASDNWSSAKDILKDERISDIGNILGFTFKSGNVSFFQQYLNDLQFGSETENNNSFLKEYLLQPDIGNAGKAKKELIKNMNSDMVFSIQMAVSAIAEAVAELCAQQNCKSLTSLQPWKLLAQLRNVTFEMEGLNLKFDDNGDINLGYDVSLWKKNGSDVHAVKIAEYYSSNNSFSLSFTSSTNQIVFEHVVSKCSNSCQPGEFKKTAEGQHTCCYECISCPENSYSNHTDTVECFSCDTHSEWSNAGSSKCNPKTFEYFEWNSGFAIVLLTLAAVGALFLILVSALFIWHRDSPVVKAAGGPLCHLILFSLLGSFSSVVFFVGEPSNMTCKVRQIIFGLSFTLCVSCILVKSLKILLAFQMNLDLKELLCKLYKPYVIIFICMTVQVIICTLWLHLCPPKKYNEDLPEVILMKCQEGSDVAFWVMLGYIALLSLVCFIFAYIGRKLPQMYNEAKFITFSMLICLMAWVIFIPVHVTTTGKYVPAVEMVVILISNFGILSCHFLPKCYIIIFKKEHNTKDAFLKNVYEYARKSAENIRSLSGTVSESKTESSIYTISTPSLLMPEEALQVSAQKPDRMTHNHTTTADSAKSQK
ncbi:G-protein coupled receptor family C group 6 member A [Xyrauchen texanus]|uniref:G-protein coupled receptor family C group 6 member A n=1 Tax=Xyrauchen texanus TaxID=154827 RepID=UPI002241985F|nr:G-protein coupled receptor family C group 6 member A [Xyrauchen texanus]